jgi:uncharacterized Zn finger protein
MYMAIRCPKCGKVNVKHVVIPERYIFTCEVCGYQDTLYKESDGFYIPKPIRTIWTIFEAETEEEVKEVIGDGRQTT